MSALKVKIITGAGVSAESGIKTFRATDGLWMNHKIEDVATPEAFYKNPALVLEFYNKRRREIKKAQPNNAHKSLALLDGQITGSGRQIDATIITQNIDDLHERAGTKKILHLHGEIFQSRSSLNPHTVYPCMDDICIGDRCELGSQLRPNIVWFNEPVEMMEAAAAQMNEADAVMIVGTSLVVYPAASLIYYAPAGTPVFIVDPVIPPVLIDNAFTIAEPATTGVIKAIDLLKKIL